MQTTLQHYLVHVKPGVCLVLGAPLWLVCSWLDIIVLCILSRRSGCPVVCTQI